MRVYVFSISGNLLVLGVLLLRLLLPDVAVIAAGAAVCFTFNMDVWKSYSSGDCEIGRDSARTVFCAMIP